MADEPTGPFRVKDPDTGHEYTSAVLFDGLDNVTSDENPAVDESGNWRAPLYAEPKKTAAAKKAETKESAK